MFCRCERKVGVKAAPTGTTMTIRMIANRLQLGMLVVVSFAALTALAHSARADGPTASGLWEKSEAGKPVVWVLIFERGGTYEGAIAKRFLKPGDDPGAVCKKCADDRRNEPLLGLTFIRGMKRNGFKYEGGDILDPRDGKIYSANMTVSPDGQALTLRGYMGISILGHDEIWNRLPASAVHMLDASVRARYVPAEIPAISSGPRCAPRSRRWSRRSPIFYGCCIRTFTLVSCDRTPSTKARGSRRNS
jgi:hypothetical protein